MNYDVIVVGAGPAGSAAARECAELGLSTLCVEEHGTIGYPVQCAGLLSTAAFAECRISSGRSVLNNVSGARVISGAGPELLIDAKTTKAFVVDRGTLDREMAEGAADAGAGDAAESGGEASSKRAGRPAATAIPPHMRPSFKETEAAIKGAKPA